MIKSDLIKSMKEFVGCGWISRKELARYMGYKDSNDIAYILEGLPRIKTKYFVEDVALSIVAHAKN